MRMRQHIAWLALLLVSCTAGRSPDMARNEAVVGHVPYDSPIASAVNEYFHLRSSAIVARNPEPLWSRYPALRDGEDLPTGINTEGYLATRADTSRSLADLVYELERYERMRFLSQSANAAVVRVHGLERYIERDYSNGTAGEFMLDLYLRHDDDRWTVTRSDEVTLAEWHATSGR